MTPLTVPPAARKGIQVFLGVLLLAVAAASAVATGPAAHMELAWLDGAKDASAFAAPASAACKACTPGN